MLGRDSKYSPKLGDGEADRTEEKRTWINRKQNLIGSYHSLLKLIFFFENLLKLCVTSLFGVTSQKYSVRVCELNEITIVKILSLLKMKAQSHFLDF